MFQRLSATPMRAAVLLAAAVAARRSSAPSRALSMAASMAAATAKREGDISDSFASMAGRKEEPLPDHFRELKLSLVRGHEKELVDSWNRLLAALKDENRKITQERTEVIPALRFSHLDSDIARRKAEILYRGVAVIQGVVPEAEARSYKDEIEEYVRKNPSTRGFPQDNKQVFELYWSRAQLKARAHPNLLKTSRALLSQLWHTGASPDARIDLSTTICYADRLRIRQPGDASFALGPHQDGGSVERWMREGYGRGGVYDPVFAGRWDAAVSAGGFDPWDGGARVHAVLDLYNGLGACSAFRAFQGWLSMSRSAANQGTLLVYPSMKLATAYTLLRPFFRPLRSSRDFGDGAAPSSGGSTSAAFLDEQNWAFTAGDEMTSDLQGAAPGHGQEFPRAELHPHLELAKTMVHIPEVKPGDFVVWHCDAIHAVDSKHNGTSDSSVLYIPVCPVTEKNAHYLARQRDNFLRGTPSPDFPGGKGESEHVDRPTEDEFRSFAGAEGLQAMGLARLPETTYADGLSPGARAVRERHNAVLGL